MCYWKKISGRKESTENINGKSETEFASVEDTLNMHRTASNETTLVSDIPNIINEEDVIIAPEQGKKNSFDFKQWILWKANISVPSS